MSVSGYPISLVVDLLCKRHCYLGLVHDDLVSLRDGGYDEEDHIIELEVAWIIMEE